MIEWNQTRKNVAPAFENRHLIRVILLRVHRVAAVFGQERKHGARLIWVAYGAQVVAIHPLLQRLQFLDRRIRPNQPQLFSAFLLVENDIAAGRDFDLED